MQQRRKPLPRSIGERRDCKAIDTVTQEGQRETVAARDSGAPNTVSQGP